MIRSIIICALGVIVLIGSGCTTYSGLRLTEVAGGTVELYLEQSNQLDFGIFGTSLEVKTEDGHNNSLNLLGAMPGGSYLVVFEEIGYTGQPVSVTYTDPFSNAQCAGIKVAESFFGWVPGATSFAFRIAGDLTNFYGVRIIVDDVVTFGTRPRPSIGGSFTEDTSLPVSLPPFSRSMSRKWGASGSIMDNKSESDWESAFPTFCGPTQ